MSNPKPQDKADACAEPRGPEQGAKMAYLSRRALTRAEIALGRSVFYDEIAWGRVRVAQIPAAGFAAMVPMGHAIYFSGVRALADFAAASSGMQGLFVHELTHVWQAARGVRLPLAKLGALGLGAYQVRLEPGKRFKAYNIEAQAEIVRFMFLARLSPLGPHKELEALWAGRSP